MEDLTGRQFGAYRIVAPLGEGGMAAVYKAYQANTDRYVALKILPAHFAGDPQFAGRFEQEAKMVARLQHTNILPVFDFGQADGYTFIVMPFVETGTLAQLLAQGPLPLSRISQVVSQVASALDYAHARGVVHRDVKPSNILLDQQGNCLLTDFGVAKMVEGTQAYTQTGTIVGTPAYMSPEQIRGEKLDGRSDIYSLGIILYEMATGRTPFRAETPPAVLVKHLLDPLPPPHLYNADLPEEVERVILKALSKARAARYGTAGEMATALARAIASPGASAGPVRSDRRHPATEIARPPTPPKPPRRLPAWGLPAIGLLVLAGVLVALYWILAGGDQDGVATPLAEPKQAQTDSTATAHELVPTNTTAPTSALILPATPTTEQTVTQMMASATICVVAYDDVNRNGVLDGSETSIPGVTLTLIQAGEAVDSQISSAAVASTCFQARQAGSYLISQTTPPGREPTGPSLPVDVVAGQTITVHLGSVASSASGLVAYTTGQVGAWQIVLADPRTEMTWPLTGTPANSGIPAWLPGGESLAFRSDVSGRWQIYTISRDGTGLRQLTAGLGNNTEAVWSPDGLRVAFVSDRDGDMEIFVMDASGANERQLTSNTVVDDDPKWSPDGHWIVFESHQSGRAEIYRMQPDGGGLTRLTNQGDSNSTPDWSPGGEWIAYERRSGNEFHIWIMSGNDSVARQLTFDGSENLRPTWAPDGKRIAFTSNRDGQYAIWLLSVEGDQSLQRLSAGEGFDAAWSHP